jgi:hypothetical protein
MHSGNCLGGRALGTIVNTLFCSFDVFLPGLFIFREGEEVDGIGWGLRLYLAFPRVLPNLAGRGPRRMG